MASSWQFVPRSVIQQDERQKKAKAWAGAQRGRLAEEWAARKRRELEESQPEQQPGFEPSTPGERPPIQPDARQMQQPDFGLAGPGEAPPQPVDRMAETNDWARQNVPGYAGTGDVLGKTGESFEWLDQKARESALRIGDRVNPLGPRWNDIPGGNFDDNAPSYDRTIEEEAKKGWTPMLSEGPVRGTAGLLSESINKHFTGRGILEAGEMTKNAATMSPQEFLEWYKQKAAKDREKWQQWETEQTNPVVETAGALANPINAVGPGELGMLARQGGGLAKAAIGEKGMAEALLKGAGKQLPELGQRARQFAMDQTGALKLPGGDDIAKGEVPSLDDFAKQYTAHERRLKLAEEKPLLLKGLRHAKDELDKAVASSKPRVIKQQERAVADLEKRLQENLNGRFVDEESAAFDIWTRLEQRYKKTYPQSTQRQPVVAQEQSDIAKGKVSAKTGFTKGQEQYLAGKLEEVAPGLPEQTPAMKDKEGKLTQPEPKASIKVPGDGTVTVWSQDQASNLHNIITGESLTIPGQKYSRSMLKAFDDWRADKVFIGKDGRFRMKTGGKNTGPLAPWDNEATTTFKTPNEFLVAEQVDMAENRRSLPVGSSLNLMGTGSTLARTVDIGGVRYELFRPTSLRERKAAIRVTDIDSGETVTLKQHPSFNGAELEYERTLEEVRKYSQPVVETQPASTVGSEAPVTGQKVPVKQGETAPTAAAPEVGTTPEPIVSESPAIKPELATESIPEAGASKELWQMTAEEFAKSKYYRGLRAKMKRIKESPGSVQFTLVRRALEDRKPVPPEVLKDFPELAPSPTPDPGLVKPGLTAPEPIKAEGDLVKQGAREPWEMSQAEVSLERAKQDFPITGKVEVRNDKPVYSYSTTVKWGDGDRTFKIETKGPLNGVGSSSRLHKKIIEQALSEGKPVPQEIINDYPDLAAKYAKETSGTMDEGSIWSRSTPPWQPISRAEYLKQFEAQGKTFPKIRGVKTPDQPEAAHKWMVKTQLELGRPMYEGWETDYPDLAAKYAKGEQAATTPPTSASPEPLTATKPVLTYRGQTDLPFDLELESGQYPGIIHSTPSKDVAGIYAEGQRGSITPLTVTPKNLLDLTDAGTLIGSKQILDTIAARLGRDRLAGYELASALKETGYDGFKVKEAILGRHTTAETYGVFPETVKVGHEPQGIPPKPATAKGAEVPTTPAKAPEMDVQGSTPPTPLTIATGKAKGTKVPARMGAPNLATPAATPPPAQAAPPTPPAAQPPVTPTPPTPPTGPAIGQPVRPDSWLSTMKPTPEILDAAYQPDWIRRVVDKFDNPIERPIAQALGVPERNVFTQGTVLRESILADGKSSTTGAMGRLRSQGESKALFKTDKDGMAEVGGQRAPLNDVLEYPDRYSLSPEQKRYAETIHKLYDDQRDLLTAEGIDVRELSFEPGGHYVGRRVVGKLDASTGEIELAELRTAGGKRVGAKAGFEKHRQFETEAEAMAEGFRYMAPEEVLQANLQQAYRKIADKRMADLVLSELPYRTAETPEALKIAKEHAQEKLAAVGKLKATILRGYRGERVPEVTVASIGRFFPDQARILVQSGISKPENPITRALLQQAEAAVPSLKAQAQAAFYKARDVAARAREKAMQPKYGEGMVQAPAFQGKFFSEADAKRLREALDLEKPTKLRGAAEAISWVNALPRLLMTTFDVGAPFIQGQLTLFSHPVIWTRAVGRSLEALVPRLGNKGYQQFLATHAETIKKWSPDGATFTPSEFTEAIQTGGIVTKVRGLQDVARPFARGYEAFLNALRIYGLEATEGLAKTPADRAGLAKFWNQMSGVTDTARMGINPTQRATETAALFAPRYYRATMALMTDISKGGLRGKMARDALAKATIAGTLGYVGTAYAIGQEPKLDPRDPKFMTVNLAGQNIGLGGFYLMLNRALLKMAMEPGKAHEVAAGFVRDRSSPLVGTTARRMQFPYLYDTPLKLTKQVVIRNMVPIWAQGYLVEGENNVVSSIVEMGGGRAFPDRPPKRQPRRYPGPPQNIGPTQRPRSQYRYPGAP